MNQSASLLLAPLVFALALPVVGCGAEASASDEEAAAESADQALGSTTAPGLDFRRMTFSVGYCSPPYVGSRPSIAVTMHERAIDWRSYARVRMFGATIDVPTYDGSLLGREPCSYKPVTNGERLSIDFIRHDGTIVRATFVARWGYKYWTESLSNLDVRVERVVDETTM